jgi:hypothetical protein
MAEETDLKSVQCGFESHLGHMTIKNYLGFKAYDMGYDAHLTLLYLGDMDDQGNREDRRRLNEVHEWIYRNIMRLSGDAFVSRVDFAMLGPNNNIPVLKVAPPPELWTWRMKAIKDLWNGSEFNNWSPHITLPNLETFQEKITLPNPIRLGNFGLY